MSRFLSSLSRCFRAPSNPVVDHGVSRSRMTTMFVFVSSLFAFAGCESGRPGRLNPGMPRVPEWIQGVVETDRVSSDEELLFGWTPEALREGDEDPSIEDGVERGPGGLPIVSRRVLPLVDRFRSWRKPARGTGRSQPAQAAPKPAAAKKDEEEEPAKLELIVKEGDDEEEPTLPLPPERSRLESFYFGQVGIAPSRDLKQFGYDFFHGELERFLTPFADQEEELRRDPGAQLAQALHDPRTPARFPISNDYVIGPGDEVQVRIWGQHEIQANEMVNSEGQLSLPRVGALTVAGTTYGDLPQLVKTAYLREIKNFEILVTLSRLRTIRVYLVGELERPGMQEIPAGATLVTALNAAGGPKKGGSLRRINVRRRDGTDVPVDLYDFLLDGARESDLVLREEDTIVVPPIGATVGIGGYVMRPGIYETAGEPTIDEVIGLSGGVTAFGYQLFAQLERTAPNGERVVEDVPLLTDGAREHLVDGDLLLVQGVDIRVDNSVDLDGNVVRPGRFQWKPDMHVSDLLRMGGGFLTDTYFDNATITRILGRRGHYEHVVERTEISTSHQIHHVDLRKALGHPHGPDDPELKPLDTLRVFSQREVIGWPKVTIRGAIKNPGVYELTTGMRVTDLIRLAGNVTEEAYLDRAEIARRIYDEDRTRFDVVHLRFDLAEAQRDRTRDPYLKNYDELVVRSSGEAHVRVKVDGQVRFPGEYVLPRGARISDLLIACGGLSEDSDLRAAVFAREEVRRLQQERLDDLVRKAIREFERAYEAITMIGRQNESDAAYIALEQDSSYFHRMRSLQATGRVIIDMVKDDFRASTDDLVLEDGDLLDVPRKNYTVNVLGEVFNPTALVWRQGWTVNMYLEEIGGVTNDADEDRTYLVRANGTAISARQIGFGDLLDQTVLPGDTLLVPEEPAERTVYSYMKDAGELALMYGLATQAFRGGPRWR
ncbi:MAG: SLBB domain-containing protein [Planctomycetes bacterium]|nr:SLBB domain-containing protein [Planctomycetota bacterium]